jgi:hypothetical protein
VSPQNDREAVEVYGVSWRVRCQPRSSICRHAPSIIEAEPFGLHFWECTPKEFLNYLKDPRGFLPSMGIKLPKNCRIETTIENHDWLSANTRKLAGDNGPVRLQRWRRKCCGDAKYLPRGELRAYA